MPKSRGVGKGKGGGGGGQRKSGGGQGSTKKPKAVKRSLTRATHAGTLATRQRQSQGHPCTVLLPDGTTEERTLGADPDAFRGLEGGPAMRLLDARLGPKGLRVWTPVDARVGCPNVHELPPAFGVGWYWGPLVVEGSAGQVREALAPRTAPPPPPPARAVSASASAVGHKRPLHASDSEEDLEDPPPLLLDDVDHHPLALAAAGPPCHKVKLIPSVGLDERDDVVPDDDDLLLMPDDDPAEDDDEGGGEIEGYGD